MKTFREWLSEKELNESIIEVIADMAKQFGYKKRRNTLYIKSTEKI